MIEVLRAGLFTTVQDNGRYGFRNLGVPLSGVMHHAAYNHANALLQNDANDAVLEITMTGPILKFTTATYIAITGASFTIRLNASEIAMNEAIAVQPNDVLTIDRALQGMRCYLSVKGGLQTEKILDSRSFYRGITASTVLKKGVFLPINSYKETLESNKISEEKSIENPSNLEVYKGQEFEQLPLDMQTTLLQANFTIAPQSNRMAYLLTSEINLSATEIHTGPVQPGTVQLTPSGKMIVLMRDAQTTGGYARILQLSEAAIGVLAQKRAGAVIGFTITDFPS